MIATITVAQGQNMNVDDIQAMDVPFIRVLPAGSSSEIPLLPDSLFYAEAGSLIYRVNKYNLPANSPFLKEIEDIVAPMANMQNLQLVAIHLRGAASPEGPERWNFTLGERRAKTLMDYLSSRLTISPDVRIVTDNGVEDYIGLCHLLHVLQDRDAERVQHVVESVPDRNNAETKRRIMALDGGKVWKRLLRDVFPKLRAARLIMYLTPVDGSPNAALDPRIYAVEIPLPAVGLVPVDIDFESAELQLEPDWMPRRHCIAVTSNLLYDVYYQAGFGFAPMLNGQLEFFPRYGNWSFIFGFTSPYYHKWEQHKFFQIRDYHFEARRYFRPGFHHTGAYLGAYVNNAKYGIGFSATKGWEGEGFGGALKLGYVIPLGKRWRMDFHIAGGTFYTRFDPYVWGNPITGEIDNEYYYKWTLGSATFRRRNHQLSWLGPTEVGVTLSCDLLFYRNALRGVSFKRKEVKR